MTWNPFRRAGQLFNIITIRNADGAILHTIQLPPPTPYGPNTCDIVIPAGVDPDRIAWEMKPDA